MSASASDTMSYAKSLKGKNYSQMSKLGMRGGHPNAWCADFVSFVLSKKGVKSGLNSSSQQFINMSGWHKKTKPKVGDVYVLTGNNSSTTGHTGFVVSVSGSGKSYSFTCIAGNSGGKVSSESYKSSYAHLTGFWTPPYSGSSSGGSKSDKDYKEIEIRNLEGELNVRPHAVSIKADVADTIKLSGFGKYLSGLYYVTEVHRSISTSGFTQSMNVLKKDINGSLKDQQTNVVQRGAIKRE